jgi:phosphate-selective porin
VQPTKLTALAAALLTLYGPHARSQTNAELIQELKELRRQVQELRDQVKEVKSAAAPGWGASAPQAAQSPEAEPATQADLQGLRADLENYKYDQARQYERTTAKTVRNTTITGNLTASASWNDPKTPSPNAANTNRREQRSWGFDTPSATINFNGILYRDYQEGRNLTYTFGLTGASSIAVQDAYLRYSFAPTNGGPDDPILNLSFGQQQVPFGLEAQANTEIRPVIAGAQFLSATGLGGANFGNRQIGLVVRGDTGINVDRTTNYRSALFEYAAGILNGNGPNTSDNNGKRDLVARAAFTVPADYNSLLRELKFGASYYKGYGNLTNNAAPAATFVARNGRSDRLGIDVNYTRLPWSVAYERVEGRDDGFANATFAAPYSGSGGTRTRKSVGQYLNIGYTVGEQFLASSRNQGKFDDYWPKTIQYFVRFDTYDADTDSSVKGDESRLTTFGINAYFAETTRFQVNYVLRRNDEPSSGFTAARPRTTKGLVARFVYGF